MKKEVIKNIIKDLENLTKHIKELVEEDSVKSKNNDKSVCLEDVRAVLAKLSQHGKTKDVKELITKYGASKLSEVDESKYMELLKEAEEIKID